MAHIMNRTISYAVSKNIPQEMFADIEALAYCYMNRISDENGVTLLGAVMDTLKENIEGEPKTTMAYKVTSVAIVIHGILSKLAETEAYDALINRIEEFMMNKRVPMMFILSLMGDHLALEDMMDKFDDRKEILGDGAYLNICNVLKTLHKYSNMVM